MIGFMDIIHRPIFLSIDWAQLSMLLPENGDKAF
jgi:hypothetical protein